MKRKNSKKWWMAVAVAAVIGIGIYVLPLKNCASMLTERSDNSNNGTFTYKRIEHAYENKNATCKVITDFPTSGPSFLKDAVRGVLTDLLYVDGLTEPNDLPDVLDGNFDVANQQIKQYVENTGANLLEEVTDLRKDIDKYDFRKDIPFYWMVDFTVGYETPKYVTYKVSWLTYRGDQHEVSYESGVTIRKKDGMLMNWDDVLVDEHDMQDFIKKGLKEFFNVTTDEELIPEVDLWDDFQHLPLPHMPIFEKDSLSFIYQFYEISSWGSGKPKFKVAYKDLAPQMKPEALKLAKGEE